MPFDYLTTEEVFDVVFQDSSTYVTVGAFLLLVTLGLGAIWLIIALVRNADGVTDLQTQF